MPFPPPHRAIVAFASELQRHLNIFEVYLCSATVEAQNLYYATVAAEVTSEHRKHLHAFWALWWLCQGSGAGLKGSWLLPWAPACLGHEPSWTKNRVSLFADCKLGNQPNCYLWSNKPNWFIALWFVIQFVLFPSCEVQLSYIAVWLFLFVNTDVWSFSSRHINQGFLLSFSVICQIC